MKCCCCLLFITMWVIAGILCVCNGNYPEIGLNNYKKDHHIVSRTKVLKYEKNPDKNRKSDDAWKFEIRTINQDDTSLTCEDDRERLSRNEAEYLQEKYPNGKNVTVYYQGGYSGPCLILNTSGLKAAAIAGIVLLSPFALVIGIIGVVIAFFLLCGIIVLTFFLLNGIMVCVLSLVQGFCCISNKDAESKTVELPTKCGSNAV